MMRFFGRQYYVNSISVKSSTPSGRKTTHRDSKIIKTKDYFWFIKCLEKLK